MSEHPKTMEEFAAGMRGAGVRKWNRTGSFGEAVEAAIAYVREHSEFVEGYYVVQDLATGRTEAGSPKHQVQFRAKGRRLTDPIRLGLIGERTTAIVPKPEPKPDVRDLLERAMAFVGETRGNETRLYNDLRAALKESNDEDE